MNKNTNTPKKDELGALWKKKSKSGMSFLSGYIKVDDLGLEKEIKVVVFANSNKSNEKAPDYRVYISKPLTGEVASTTEDTKKVKPILNKKVSKPEQQEEEEEDIL